MARRDRDDALGGVAPKRPRRGAGRSDGGRVLRHAEAGGQGLRTHHEHSDVRRRPELWGAPFADRPAHPLVRCRGLPNGAT
mmetsp:Transcript_1816/g.4100  ORF Transcript_1816/g.4100 Transcript_1816/m.4100 type:complete len:81 (+) Transcript_1816:201-443(+)